MAESTVGLLFKISADASQGLAELDKFKSTITNNLQSLVGVAAGVGASLTASLTAPLAALGGIAAKSAVDIDKQVNALKAFTGSAANAEKRLAQLIATAQNTPGLTASLAATLDAQLRVANVTEATINRILPAIGRLNAVAPLGDPAQFANNLNQLISQNFERADLKELVGRSPLGGEIIKQLFSVDNATNGEAIRASAQRLGITTAEQFFTAFATAAANNPKLAAVTESIGTQFEKIQDRVTIALRPLGLAVINAISPLIETVVPIIERVARAFSELSPGTQTAIVAIAGVVAAAGPLILALAGVAQVIIVLSEAWVVLQGALAAGGALAALPALLNPVTLAIAGVVAVLGIAALAWASYESAADRAAKISTDQIQATAASREEYVQLGRQVQDLAGKQSLNTEEHQRLQDVLSKLPASSQAVAGALKSQGDQVAFVTSELARQRGVQEATLVAQRATVASALADQQQELDGIRERKKALEDETRAVNERAKAGKNFTFLSVDGAITPRLSSTADALSDLGDRLSKVTEEEKKATAARDESASKLDASQKALGQNTAELLKYQAGAGASTRSIDSLRTGLEQHNQAQQAAKSAVNSTTSAFDAQAAAAANAAKQITAAFNSVDVGGLQKGIKERVDQLTKQVVESGGGLQRAAQVLKEARGQVVGGVLDGKPFTLAEAAKRASEAAKINEFLTKSLSPPTSSGGGGGGGASKRVAEIKADTELQLKLLRIQEQSAERLANAEINAARTGFSERRITIEQLERIVVEAEKKMLAAKEATFNEERRLLAESEKAALAVKGLPAKQRDAIAEQTKLKLAEIAEREAAVRQKAEETIARAQADTAKVRLQILDQEYKTRATLEEGASRAEINRIKQAANDKLITEEAAARRIGEIEAAQFEAKRLRLVREGILSGANLAELARINGELAKLAQDQAIAQEDSQRRIAEARQKDLASLRAFAAERQKLTDSLRQSQVQELQRAADGLQNRAQANPSNANRADAIQARLAAQAEAANVQNELNQRQIESSRASLLSLINTSDLTEENLARIAEVERLINEQRLAEDRRFNDERARIRGEAAAANAANDPTSNASVFGVTDESLSGFAAFGQAAQQALGQVAGAGQNVKQILGGVFSTLASGAQRMLESFVLTGKIGGAAFKQLAASIISSLAIQSVVKAIFNLAEGFANLALGNAKSAAENFAAAKLYTVVAAAAGGAALAIGAAGGLGGGGGGSESQGAGQFGGQSQKERESKFTTGDVAGKINDPENQDRGILLKVLSDQNATVLDKFTAVIDLHKEAIDRNTAANEGTREAVGTFATRITSTSPGDVFTAGAEARPDVIPGNLKSALNDDPGLSRTIAGHLQLA